MKDPRHNKLADLLVNHSTRLNAGDKILIEAIDTPKEMVIALMRSVARVGAIPIVELRQAELVREMYLLATEESAEFMGRIELERMKQMDAYVAIRGNHNIYESADVPAEKKGISGRHERPVLSQRVDHTRWCVLRWPTSAMAQQAQMSTEAFEDFFFDVCTLDYARMFDAMEPLKRLMEATDKVHIVGPGTDLQFSIKGIPAVICGGRRNIPEIHFRNNASFSDTGPVSNEPGLYFPEVREITMGAAVAGFYIFSRKCIIESRSVQAGQSKGHFRICPDLVEFFAIHDGKQLSLTFR